jgi:transposase
MPTSPDTLLRRVMAAPEGVGPPPRYVGIDDWAWRKGQSYGTVVTDLERGRVIDIFPGRDGEALKQWLHANPQVEVITRDRWPAYAKAATEASPQARQVADRWHLLKNLREAIERLFARRASSVQTALSDPLSTEPTTETPSPTVAEPVGRPAVPGESIPEPAGTNGGSPREQARQTKRDRRVELHRRVRALREQGLSLRQIARTTGASVKAVIRYIRQDRCPDWHPGRRSPTQLDGSAAFIGEWLADGGRNTAELYRLLNGRGCRASYDAVRRFVNRTLGSTGRPGPRVGQTKPPAAPHPSARKLSFVFIRRPEDRKPTEQVQVTRLQTRSPALGATLDLAAEFAGMVRKRCSTALSDWLVKAELCPDAEFRLFAASLRQDEAAVGAALTTPWSNGPVEGQVNRLKFIKRAGYGRAGFPLLRARVCRVA